MTHRRRRGRATSGHLRLQARALLIPVSAATSPPATQLIRHPLTLKELADLILKSCANLMLISGQNVRFRNSSHFSIVLSR
jgi:hypothetical protein